VRCKDVCKCDEFTCLCNWWTTQGDSARPASLTGWSARGAPPSKLLNLDSKNSKVEKSESIKEPLKKFVLNCFNKYPWVAVVALAEMNIYINASIKTDPINKEKK